MIVLTSPSRTAAISYAPPNARVESAGEGAATATRRILNTPSLGNPYLEAAVGVVGSVLAPFAAAYGATKASLQRLPPDKLSEAEKDLVRALKSNADSQALREKVAAVARQKTSRLLTCAGSNSVAPASQLPVSAVLELAVEQLKLSQTGKNDYVLCIQARARLLRASDRRVLLDKSYEYQSGPAMFIDWARYGGLEGVAQTGYQSLAEEIAADIFQPVSEPPLLIGPGQKHSSLRRLKPVARPAHCKLGRSKSNPVLCQSARREPPPRGTSPPDDNGPNGQLPPAGERPPADDPLFRSVSFPKDKVTSIEVYTRGPDDLRVQTPTSGSGNTTGVQRETDWAMDGLDNDRNSVVQFVSCLAALPMGLWEQTVVAARKPWRDKTEKLVATLDALPEQRHFAGALADEVARRLRSQVTNQVCRTDEPPGFALAIPGAPGAMATNWAQLPASTNSQLALQIQVVNAKLVGKRSSSRSRALCVETRATVIRNSDGQELFSRPILYRSSSKKLKDWAASSAKLFREELDACSRQTAQAVTGELLGHGFVTQGSGSSVPNHL